MFLQSWFSCAQTLPGVQPLGRHCSRALKQTRLCLSARPKCLQFTEREIPARGNKANVRKGSRLGGRGGAGHSKASCDYHRLWD